MRIYTCNKCKRGECPRRRSNKKINGIHELADTITHEDGSKERIIWAKIDIATDTPIFTKFI